MEKKGESEKNTTKSERLMSLDTLRGFDMLFIMGGDAFFFALGSLLPGTIFEIWGKQMRHVQWNGFSFEDLIFPLFLFLAGVSFPFSLAKQRNAGKGNREVSLRILRRGLTLVLLGLIYNGLLQFNFEAMRYASVLGRIGLAWMFAALLYVWLKRKWCITVSVTILLGYWAALALITAPDAGDASGFSIEGNIAGYIDRTILPGYLHLGIHDPEGLLSTIPAIVTALFGMFTGDFIKSDSTLSGFAKCGMLGIAALILIATGLLWDNLIPINKNLWSSSFVCFAGGLSVALFAFFYMIVDVLKWRRWTFFFRVIGMNSITIYLAQEFIDFSKPTQAIFGGVFSLFPETWYTTVYWVGYMAICWLFLYILYKQKIFLKV